MSTIHICVRGRERAAKREFTHVKQGRLLEVILRFGWVSELLDGIREVLFFQVFTFLRPLGCDKAFSSCNKTQVALKLIERHVINSCTSQRPHSFPTHKRWNKTAEFTYMLSEAREERQSPKSDLKEINLI